MEKVWAQKVAYVICKGCWQPLTRYCLKAWQPNREKWDIIAEKISWKNPKCYDRNDGNLRRVGDILNRAITQLTCIHREISSRNMVFWEWNYKSHQAKTFYIVLWGCIGLQPKKLVSRVSNKHAETMNSLLTQLKKGSNISNNVSKPNDILIWKQIRFRTLAVKLWQEYFNLDTIPTYHVNINVFNLYAHYSSIKFIQHIESFQNSNWFQC